MTTYTFVIPGPPVAKGRPRFAMRGIKAIAYTPDKTTAWEKGAKLIIRAGMEGNTPLGGPVGAEFCFHMPKPKRMTRRHPSVGADIDNLVKAACDSMNGLAYIDDAQIVRLTARKEYSDYPMVLIRISTIED